jgi:hypothetical protein
MKIKILQSEWDFDKDDAKIVVPIALLLLGVTLTQVKKEWLLSAAVIYYALYFFLTPSLRTLKNSFIEPVLRWISFRCPHCRSRDIFEQGLQKYHGDVPYYWHLCNHCGQTSILLTSGRLIKPGPGQGAKAALAPKSKLLEDQDPLL